MKKIFLITGALLIFIAAVLVARFLIGGDEDTWICDQGQWVKHGQPQSPPPSTPCPSVNASQICSSPSGTQMDLTTAQQIAQSQCSDGQLAASYSCNSTTGTWWLDFTPDQPKSGCNPACVVNIETGQAEINWRCTGLISPEDN